MGIPNAEPIHPAPVIIITMASTPPALEETYVAAETYDPRPDYSHYDRDIPQAHTTAPGLDADPYDREYDHRRYPSPPRRQLRRSRLPRPT